MTQKSKKQETRNTIPASYVLWLTYRSMYLEKCIREKTIPDVDQFEEFYLEQIQQIETTEQRDNLIKLEE